MTRQDIAIDLETIGTGPRSGILSIGAVKFDPFDEEISEEVTASFYVNIDIDWVFKRNLCDTSDISAFHWWMNQKFEARNRLFTDGQTLHTALSAFRKFCRRDYLGKVQTDPDFYNVIWGNGNMFDNVILRNAYTACNMGYPAHFKHDLDLRTLKQVCDMNGIKYREPPRFGVHHNALDDATWQAKLIQVLMAAIQESKSE